MDSPIIIFWLVAFVGISGLITLGRHARSGATGWVVVYLGILLIDGLGRMHLPVLIYCALGLWLVLVLLPGLISRLCYQRFLQNRYSEAYRLARVLGWLHPADGMREQAGIIHAVALAQRGELNAARSMLERFEGTRSVIGLVGIANLYRITSRWEEFRNWEARHHPEFERHPQLLPLLLRARGETGDWQGLVDLYARHQQMIGSMAPGESRDLCRLVLFAFGGKRQWVERLFAGSLAMLPESTRKFWLATADWAAGETESAQAQWEHLLSAAEPPLRLAIERRLSRRPAQGPAFPAEMERLIETVALEHGHDEKFGAQPSLFSRQARATQILIVFNVLMFGAELCFGGATNLDTLYRLGALYGPAVRSGEWWRLLASLFLHFGPVHLSMNMLALWVLGPFAEFALGFRKFLVVYLAAGIGSMAIVMKLATGAESQQLTVGASGCIMGLVGATGALMLRGWLKEKAASAKRRLALVVMIIVTQSLFDSLVPQVSMTAHLSGVILGFLITLVLSDRLNSVTPQLATAK